MSPSADKVPVTQFLALREEVPVVDVRSPAEYALGHIPGALNIPLFDDYQRAEVGTTYKEEGNLKAVLRGLELAGPSFAARLERAVAVAGSGPMAAAGNEPLTVAGNGPPAAAGGRPLALYCWRGGMRSEAMAWLFSLGGIEPQILMGGYKAYRNHILQGVGERRSYIILGGLTGSGKTAILRQIALSGAQVADLEGLASHRGSAFGALGLPPQPSSEHFANLLYDQLSLFSSGEPVWLEDESRNIGNVFMPDNFYSQMQESPVIALMMDIETRLPRLISEYTLFPVEEVISAIMKISKRLGEERARKAITALQQNDYSTAVRIILEYYDKAYRYDLAMRPAGQVTYIDTDTDDEVVNAGLVSAAASRLIR